MGKGCKFNKEGCIFQCLNIPTNINVIGYIIILSLLVFLLYIEIEDLRCGSGSCREGNGRAYSDTQMNDSDNKTEVLEKMKKLAMTEKQTVKWRISLILAIICTFFIFLLVFFRLPNIWEMLISIVIIFVFVYQMFNVYSFHHYSHAANNMNQGIEKLSKI